MYRKTFNIDSRQDGFIFVHGGPGGNTAYLESLISSSSRFRVKLLIYDQRGSGRSHEVAGYSHDRNVLDFASIVSENQPKGFTRVIAHSYGCAIVAAAIAHKLVEPDLVVYTSPVLDWDQASKALYHHVATQARQVDPDRFEAIFSQEYKNGLFTLRDRLVRDIIGPKRQHAIYWHSMRLFEHFWEYQASQKSSNHAYLALRPELFSNSHRLFPNTPTEFGQMLRSIDTKSFVAIGGQDFMSTASQMELFLNGSTAMEFERSGHFIQYEAFDEYFSWLNTL